MAVWVHGSRVRVYGSGLRISDLGFRVYGFDQGDVDGLRVGV